MACTSVHADSLPKPARFTKHAQTSKPGREPMSDEIESYNATFDIFELVKGPGGIDERKAEDLKEGLEAVLSALCNLFALRHDGVEIAPQTLEEAIALDERHRSRVNAIASEGKRVFDEYAQKALARVFCENL
jgi:hypothetical protein